MSSDDMHNHPFPSTECRCSRRDPINYTALNAATIHQRYAAFGLGHGVDASEPAPLKNLRRSVRNVLPNFGNTEKNIKKESDSYEDTISSMTCYSSRVTGSVSDIIGEVITLSTEAEYTREHSKVLKIKGD